MLPFIRPGGKQVVAKGIRPYLVVKLKSGWRYDDSRRVFVSPKGQDLSPPKGLPRHTRVVHMVPELARADRASLSKEERNLARYVHVILAKGSSAADHVVAVRDWPCVEEAQLSPEISLP